MLTNLHKRIKNYNARNVDKIKFYYAFALVFITPISIPLAIYTYYNHQVETHHLVMTFVMYCLGGLGISVGFHRLLSHRAFETKPWVKRILLIMGCFAMQGSPASWASLHIQHHAHTDKPLDPHAPSKKGFWYAHCGWLFHNYNPDFKKYGKWLLKDDIAREVGSNYMFYSLLGLAIPFILGGWVGLIWGGLLRLFISSHTTWCVTSVCHIWGKQAYKTTDTSRNNFIVALLTFGEGWHNNHHRFLQMPYLSHRWYQIDFGKWLIQLLKTLRLAWGLKIKPVSSATPAA